MKKFFNILVTTIFFSLFIMTESCNKGNNSSQKFIDQPFESAKIKFSEFEINNSNGDSISMPNGSKIIIPANAFVNKEKQPVQGKVKIMYREFHDAADIVLSGIPMQYDSGGVKMNFQTAGMFEILGFQKNEPVFIARDKSIEVKLASNVGEDTYNFYLLDTVAGNWMYKGKSSPLANVEKQRKIEAESGPLVVKPIEPAKFDPDQFVFDVKINIKKYPELTDFHDIIWQYAGNSDSLDPEKNDWIFTEKWTNMELQMKDNEQSVFWLTLSNKKRNFRTLAKAVFSDKKIENAKKNFQKRKEAYDAYIAKRKEVARRFQNEWNFMRSFQVQNLGIHNWDQIFPGMQIMAANFKFDQEVDTTQVSVFLITGDDRVAIRYRDYMWKNFMYPINQNSLLVAIMPGDKIAVNKEITPKFGREKSPEKHTFKFTTINKKIENPNDLREVFSKLY